MSNKSKLIAIIVAGLILASIGIFVGFNLIQSFQTGQVPEEAAEYIVKTKVVVVTRDLVIGNTISGGDVELADVPVEIAPRNAVANLDEAIGKIIKTDLVQGEMILGHNLADPTNNNHDLGFILNEDHVLMAFPADDLMSREGIIQQGDIVDIFATFKQEIEMAGNTASTVSGESQEPEERTFTVDSMQKVGVTALVLEAIEGDGSSAPLNGGNEQAGSKPKTRIRAYLLALNSQDALILKHLKDTGAIFDIVLRAPTSNVQFNLTPVTEEYIVEFYGLGIIP